MDSTGKDIKAKDIKTILNFDLKREFGS